MAKVVGDGIVPGIPLCDYDAWVARGVDWLVMSEDLPDLENRVMLDRGGARPPALPSQQSRPAQQLVATMRRLLRRLGFWKVMTHSHRTKNTTHQCGTLVFGTTRPGVVLDPFCRTHDIPNLFVVDASFFPSSAAVNPSLTIIAQALRVADHIKETEWRLRADDVYFAMTRQMRP